MRSILLFLFSVIPCFAGPLGKLSDHSLFSVEIIASSAPNLGNQAVTAVRYTWTQGPDGSKVTTMVHKYPAVRIGGSRPDDVEPTKDMGKPVQAESKTGPTEAIFKACEALESALSFPSSKTPSSREEVDKAAREARQRRPAWVTIKVGDSSLAFNVPSGNEPQLKALVGAIQPCLTPEQKAEMARELK